MESVSRGEIFAETDLALGERVTESSMNVKEAVKKAIEHVAEVFEAEKPTDIGLEEVSLNEQDDTWEVTIGLSRPWDYPKGLVAGLQPQNPRRQYKVVKIDFTTVRAHLQVRGQGQAKQDLKASVDPGKSEM